MKAEIKLGPAGSGGSNLDGIRHVKKIGLQAMEVEFTYGVKMSLELAKQVGELAKKLNIQLSVHAPYWINLASQDSKKLEESKKRILDSCEKAHYLGAKYVVFHPGFYEKRDPEIIYKIIKESLQDIVKRNKYQDVKLACETTGKTGAFGTLQELLKLKKEIDIEICVDFAHIYARQKGKIDYAEVLKNFKGEHLHSHFSGIAYTEKGEKNHLIMGKPDFSELAKEILKQKQDITIICESPVTWQDSLKQKEILEKLGYNF